MSKKDTTILNKSDLKYLLIDSLALYTSNLYYIDGNNPYRFSINKKEYYILIKNVHESGENRTNQDECRIQVSKSSNFNSALSGFSDVIVFGYFHDTRTFTAWNPFQMRDRFNQKSTISLYSRFSTQVKASEKGIAVYKDNNKQSIISFKAEYLGLYIENISKIHILDEKELLELIARSDTLNDEKSDGTLNIESELFTITHTPQVVRDPNFRKKVYASYLFKCAMCGISLKLVEAAHIVPHSHEKGTDDINNGVCLCALHHTAYDQSLIYFDEKFNIKINVEKLKYLEKLGLDSGFRKVKDLLFDKIILPENLAMHPNTENIKLANQIRGIEDAVAS
jgi:putative restriction endonuclease